MQVFWRQGYESTSLSDLTAAMGINPPSLYAAFGDKERLFFESIERYLKGFGSSPIQYFDEQPTARTAIEGFLKGVARELTSHSHPPGCMVVSAALSCSDDSVHVQAKLAVYRKMAQSRIQGRIEKGMSEGEISPDTDAHLLARFFVTVIQGMTVQARDGASREDLEAVVDVAMVAWPEELVSQKRAKAA
jgi:AcrR family transcriptional regulator